MISVIVPVYNVAPYLRQCIDSILAQTYQGFELLIIDDGSTDDSPAICDTYDDKRVHVWHLKNGGVSAARNYGIKQASGEWIVFVDGDDWLEPTMFADLLDLQKRTGARTVCCNEYDVIDGKPSVRYHFDQFVQGEEATLTGTDAINLIVAKFGHVMCKLFDASFIKQLCFDEDICCGEDFLFIARYLSLNSTVAITKKPEYFYRIETTRESGATRLKLKEEDLGAVSAMERCMDILVQHDAYIALGTRGYGTARTILRLIPLRGDLSKNPYMLAVKQLVRDMDPYAKKIHAACHPILKREARRILIFLAKHTCRMAIIYARIMNKFGRM